MSTCGPDVTERPEWCLPEDQLHKLLDFGHVPSHMILAPKTSSGGRRALDQATLNEISAGLIEGNNELGWKEIISQCWCLLQVMSGHPLLTVTLCYFAYL